MSLVLLILQAIVVLVGLAFVPLLGYVFGSSLNYLRLGEPLASIVLSLALLPIPDPVIGEAEDGTLEVVPGSQCDGSGPTVQLGFVSVRLGAEVSEAAFRNYVADVDVSALEDSSDESRPTHGPVRQGVESFVNPRTDSGKLLVRSADALRRFRLGSGADVGVEAGQRAEEKYTGDTGDYSDAIHIGVSLLMFFTGLAIGWVIFF